MQSAEGFQNKYMDKMIGYINICMIHILLYVKLVLQYILN